MDAEAFVEAQVASLLTLDGDGLGPGFGLPPFFGEGAGAGEDAYDYALEQFVDAPTHAEVEEMALRRALEESALLGAQQGAQHGAAEGLGNAEREAWLAAEEERALAEAVALSLADALSTALAEGSPRSVARYGARHGARHGAQHDAVHDAQYEYEELPPGWCAYSHQDERLYYAHHESGVVQWEHPNLERPLQPPPPPTTTTGAGASTSTTSDPAAAAAADAEELMLREALEQSLLWGKAEEEAREEGLVPDFLRYET
jgi:hypothetical protein